MEVQKELDFSGRGAQLDALRDCYVPTVRFPRGGSVDGSLAKAVLRAIDGYGRGRMCFVGLERLSLEVQKSVRQVKRAISALQSLNLLAVELRGTPSGIVCNHYSIIWTEVARTCQTFENRTERRAPRRQTMGHTGPSDGPRVSNRWATGVQPMGHGCPPKRSANEPPPEAQAGSAAAEGVWSEEERQTVRSELRAAGIERVDPLAAEFEGAGQSPAEIVAACLTYRANRSAFRGPGAIADRLRSGSWPAEVKSVESRQATDRRDDQRDRERVFYAIVRGGRSRGATDGEIRPQLVAALSEEFVQSQGW